jgi:hypothetical protein
MTIGPDGTPWASYFFPCNDDPQAQTDPVCEGDYFQGQNVTPSDNSFAGGTDRGMVGSLLLPRPT